MSGNKKIDKRNKKIDKTSDTHQPPAKEGNQVNIIKRDDQFHTIKDTIPPPDGPPKKDD